MEKRLLRPDEAAAILQISRWTVYRWVDDGRLRATKVGPGSLRIFSDSVKDLISGNTVEAKNLSHP